MRQAVLRLLTFDIVCKSEKVSRMMVEATTILRKCCRFQNVVGAAKQLSLTLVERLLTSQKLKKACFLNYFYWLPEFLFSLVK